MNPQLVGIGGPVNGSTVALSEGELTVGRDGGNALCIPESSVSRRHCVIRRRSGVVTIVDLDSRNGTAVNDLPVREHILAHGDRIRLGSSHFVYLAEASDPPGSLAPALVDDDSSVISRTVVIPALHAPYPRPGESSAALPHSEGMLHDLNTILKIGTTLNSIRSLGDLVRRLLELTFEVIPAQRGAILLLNGDNETNASIFALDRDSANRPRLQLSRTVIRRVLQEGVALLSNDVPRTGGLNESQSLLLAAVRSLLAVPLIVFDRKLGVLYLDKRDLATQFDEHHLRLATAIAAMAAVALDNASRWESLEAENRRLQSETSIEHNMVGESLRMREVYQIIAKAAPTDSTILIRGESGTGKELVARAIHCNSPRSGKPFVAINCAAITETLLESELFGHEKGSFTGAISQKIGKLETARGGTLFLDEIGELAPPLQAKLLRVLQEHEFERVGGTRPISIDIRLVAATNKDLEEAMQEGAFRRDLYYRLNVVSISMPPLRERREDISLLASYFASKYAGKTTRRLMGFSAQARECLMSYAWPGNVRELENAIERAVVLGSSEVIRPEDLPEAVLEAESAGGACATQYHESIRNSKKQLILQALEQAKGSFTEAAKLLGVHPNYLHRLVRNMNLRAALKKAGSGNA